MSLYIVLYVYVVLHVVCCCFFFFNDTATTEIYTLSLHDALPIWQTFKEVSKCLFLCIVFYYEYQYQAFQGVMRREGFLSFSL